MSEERSFCARGAYISADACYPIWHALQRHLGTIAARDGVRPSPPVREAMDALREAAMLHMSPSGRGDRSTADISLVSVPDRQVVTTKEFAGLLRVSERHARRVASDLQIAPVARGLWDRQSVNYILAVRRGERKDNRQ